MINIMKVRLLIFFVRLEALEVRSINELDVEDRSINKLDVEDRSINELDVED